MRVIRYVSAVVLVIAGLGAAPAAARTARLPVPAAVQYFPGDYYTGQGRAAVARIALVRWPGPAELVRRWRAGPANERQRVGLLLGVAYFHDPVFLPIYRQALADPDPRIREAAAFAARELIAAPLPDVRGGVDAAAARRLNREIAGVQAALRSRSLVGYWLDRLAAAEGGPDALRVRGEAVRALDVLLRPEDLPELVAGYLRLGSRFDRYALLPLLQAMTCRRFIVMPAGPRAGWGPEVYREAAEDFDAWLAAQPDLEPGAVLRNTLAAYGMAGVDPMGAEACGVWLRVLQQGRPFQWALASRQLYRCGGPPVGISMLSRSMKELRARREAILRWYGLGRKRRGRRRR